MEGRRQLAWFALINTESLWRRGGDVKEEERGKTGLEANRPLYSFFDSPAFASPLEQLLSGDPAPRGSSDVSKEKTVCVRIIWAVITNA